jgi:hypothetical protein
MKMQFKLVHHHLLASLRRAVRSLQTSMANGLLRPAPVLVPIRIRSDPRHPETIRRRRPPPRASDATRSVTRTIAH